MQRVNPMRVVLWIGLALSLLILIGASFRSPFENILQETAIPTKPVPRIPPGREKLVMAFLGPVIKNGFSGATIANISLVQSEIRLELSKKAAPSNTPVDTTCTLAEWAHGSGSIVVLPREATVPKCPPDDARHCGVFQEQDLTLAWATCAAPESPDKPFAQTATEWTIALANRDHSAIWERPVEKQSENTGLLTPIVSWTGFTKTRVVRLLVRLSILTTFFAALILRWRLGRAPLEFTRSTAGERRDWKGGGFFLGLVLVLGIAFRIYAAATHPHDPDEIFSEGYFRGAFSGDHDSWVHPPLYRLVHAAWFDVAGLSASDPLWKLRLPSLVLSILALCFLAVAIRGLRRFPYVELPFAFAALSPLFVHGSVLARPYGLALFGATTCLLSVASRDLSNNKKDDWFVWFVALISLGLTIWADLITGLFAGVFVLARWLDPRSFSRQSRISGRVVTGLCVLVWALPFAVGIPGAVRASTELGWPFRSASSSQSGFEQATNLVGSVVGMGGEAMTPGRTAQFFAIAIMLGLTLFAIRRTRTSVAYGFGLLLVALVIVSSYVGMRPRNAVILPVALTLVGSLVVAHLPTEAWQKAIQRRRTK